MTRPFASRVVVSGEIITVGQVWREGKRIRRSNGTGYGDTVTDDQIRQHITDARVKLPADELGFIVFAEAVLLLREFERRTKVLV